MDPFSAEGELVNLHNAFHEGRFQAVVDFDTSALSASNTLPARVLQLRAQIQLGQADEVISELEGEDDTVDYAAVKAFATLSKDPEDQPARDKAVELSKTEADNLTVQLLCGTILANAGLKEDALALLSRHQGSLDAVALIVQIHLSQNRLDLAQQEVRRARGWAQDNLLVNIAESWVGLREGGEKYQAAFYVFEELATAPSTSSARSILAQAVAELHLGRLPEAEAAMGAALAAAPDDADVLANAAVLNTVLGKPEAAAEMKARLVRADEGHALVKDLGRKREAFEAARGKWSPRFEVQGEA